MDIQDDLGGILKDMKVKIIWDTQLQNYGQSKASETQTWVLGEQVNKSDISA